MSSMRMSPARNPHSWHANRSDNGTTNLSGRQSPWAVSSSASIIAPAYPSSHGNFLKNIPSPKGEKSTALETDRGPQRGRRRREGRIEGKEKGERGNEMGRKEDNGERGGGGNSGVHRPHWQQQWQPAATPQILQSCWTSCSLHNRIRMNRPLPPSLPLVASSYGFILFTRRFYPPALRTASHRCLPLLPSLCSQPR